MKRKENKKASKTKTFDDAAFNCKYIFKIYSLTGLVPSSPHLLFFSALFALWKFAFGDRAQKESENKNWKQKLYKIPLRILECLHNTRGLCTRLSVVVVVFHEWTWTVKQIAPGLLRRWPNKKFASVSTSQINQMPREMRPTHRKRQRKSKRSEEGEGESWHGSWGKFTANYSNASTASLPRVIQVKSDWHIYSTIQPQATPECARF